MDLPFSIIFPDLNVSKLLYITLLNTNFKSFLKIEERFPLPSILPTPIMVRS